MVPAPVKRKLARPIDRAISDYSGEAGWVERRAGRTMDEFLDRWGAWLLSMSVAVTVLAVVAGYLITTIRGKSAVRRYSASDLLTNFLELNAKGELSDDEFRCIKTMLAERLRNELKETDETG
jgi:uncharacterized membrane protein